MELHHSFKLIILASILTIISGIPSSIVEQLKNNDLRNNKVKRAQSSISDEENTKDIQYYGKPTAIKRGTISNLKSPNPDQQSLNEWEREQQSYYQNPDALSNIQTSLYNNDNSFDEKTIAEYEKGFHYGTNKEKLDEALENAVLKSELYGEPIAMNQYRYFGNDDKRRRRRKRRDTIKTTSLDRLKRDVDLTPEEVLSILTLYDNDRQNAYRPWNFEQTEQDQDVDEQWLDTPVYPQINRANDIGPEYMFEEKRGRWGGVVDERRKRFMVSKKWDNPNRNNFYTLSQLLNNKRQPNVPVYHRLIL